MLRSFTFAVATILMSVAAGCGNGIQEEIIEVKASNDPLHEPRSVLERYAKGQPPGSEVSGFPMMVDRVRESDPATADMLKEGLDKIQKSGKAERVKVAKELQAKIAPKSGY